MQEPEDNSTIDGRILKMYQILEFKGKGAYGMVWKAVEKSSRKVVALKKMRFQTTLMPSGLTEKLST